MQPADRLAGEFEQRRTALTYVATHLLGGTGEAEDAVQETWLRLARVNRAGIDNLDGWLRTALVRICLDVLKAPRRRRERPVEESLVERLDRLDRADRETGPEDLAERDDAVSRALVVVLDTLPPAERVAFVLHDLFGVSFAEVAPLVGRSEDAAKQLASRGRRRVRGRPAVSTDRLRAERGLVDRFLAAARIGDLDAVLEVLAPDVERRADAAVLPPGAPQVVRGRDAVGRSTLLLGTRAQWAAPALVGGHAGAVVALDGRFVLALGFVVGERIESYEVVADPARLAVLEVGMLDLPDVGPR